MKDYKFELGIIGFGILSLFALMLQKVKPRFNALSSLVLTSVASFQSMINYTVISD